MHAIRQKCRPKHQVLILKCYPRTTKGAVDVKPNSSELSYLLYYATTRRSKVQKVGAFLEKKTASDVWRARIGNVQVTLQILAALIEKAPRDLPLYAPYVLRILSIILRSRDITMVEASTPTFEAFCEHHDGASLSADQEYLHQYEEIVQMYASFAAKKTDSSKVSMSAPVSMRWRITGLQAIKSVASSEALSSLAGRQLHVVIPVLLENVGPDNEDFLNTLDRRTRMEEKSDVDRAALLRRKTSVATVRTVENSTGTEAAAVSGTTADADKLAEEDIGILAIQCLKQIFVGNNRSQIHGATMAALRFISELVAKGQNAVWDEKSGSRSWAIQIFEMIARWTPVQDRYVILVTTMDTLIRSPPVESNLKQHLVFATMIDSLLKSDINLIGLSVMDVLLGLIQHVLRVLQLNGAAANLQQENGSNESKPGFWDPKPALPPQILSEKSTVPTDIRRDLLARLQQCIGSLATHVYYADQIPDMVTALLLRLKPSALSIAPGAAVSVGTTDSASAPNGELTEDQSTDGFFSFDHAKVCALEAIKAILLVASAQKSLAGGSLGRNRVPLRVWEGTQWLLRDSEWKVREAYVDALLTWLDREMTKTDLRVFEEKSKGLAKTGRDDSATNLTKRAVSNASQREKTPKPLKTAFLQLLHLAVYENALEYVESESDTVLLHLLLTTLVEKLGVNAVRSGLPMIFRLQEDILEAETPSSKIRMGSLCHGYFWAISEKFDFESSPIGIAVQNEIRRRQSKSFWVAQVVLPPVPLAQIDIASAVQKHPPYDLLESESLIPFDDRFQMVKLISLSYADSLRSPVASPPTSPGRGPAHPILSGNNSSEAESSALPDKIKNEMMSEWTKESVIRLVQESSKTVSLSGSRTTANMTGHRNFLAVNGALKNGGTSSGTDSPPGNHTHNHRSRPASTNYGLVGALGKLKKVPSPAAATESSRTSVTRVDQLKRVLSGQPGLPGTKDVAHSDASSESMVSYDYTASEISFNPAQQNHAAMERSASLRDPNDRSRSKSRERVTSPDEKARALASHPVMVDGVAGEEEELDFVPPVPPLPAALTGEGTMALDYATKEDSSRGPSPRKDERSFTRSSWDGRSVVGPDLQSLLSAIDAVEEQKGNVAKPPY